MSVPFVVTAIVGSNDNGSDWWRHIEPFLLANANGYECYLSPFGAPLKHRPHVLILRGMFFIKETLRNLADQCAKDRVLLTFDYDDAFHLLHTEMDLTKVTGNDRGGKIVRENCIANVQTVHLVTTTTPYLKAETEKVSGRRDVAVIPNAINLTSWNYLRPSDPERPILMVMGGSSHWEDWHFLPELFGQLAPVFPSLRFRIAGAPLEGWIDDLRSWLGDRLETTRWRRHEEYPRVYDGATICLAPLRDTVFNRCRTPIKYWEATAAGAAFIGSSVLYAEEIRSGENGYLAETVDEYATHIATLLTDPDRRERMVSLARQTVRDHLLDQEAIEARWAIYWNAYHARYGSFANLEPEPRLASFVTQQLEVPYGARPVRPIPETTPSGKERLWTPGGGRLAGVPFP